MVDDPLYWGAKCRTKMSHKPFSRANQRELLRKIAESAKMAGRQGFELGAGSVSNLVMARDFWC
jgi:hypothetical protein